MVIHTDSDTGQPYELLILDAPTIGEAVNVWRWNVGGLGFSSNGYNGPYDTAITADGQIVADFITSGTLVANIIKAGVLQSQDGSSYWDLETGEVVLRPPICWKTMKEFSPSPSIMYRISRFPLPLKRGLWNTDSHLSQFP